MLLWLAQFFQDEIGPLRVFNFITFRAVFAAATALLIGLCAGPAVIRMLTAMKYGQAVRTDGPQTHLKKHGTPTMGGLLILIAIGVSTLLWCDLSNRLIWPVLVVTLGFGAVGWVDDYRKVVRQDPAWPPRCTWRSRCRRPTRARSLSCSSPGCSRAFRWICRRRPT
jgi:phospho-N-acetylmuramoyl-pentapeptide-transferase